MVGMLKIMILKKLLDIEGDQLNAPQCPEEWLIYLE